MSRFLFRIALYCTYIPPHTDFRMAWPQSFLVHIRETGRCAVGGNEAIVQTSPTADSVSVKPAFPFLDLKAQYRAIKDEVEIAIQRVMESQQFIHGPEVESLEQEVASYTETGFGISCASGSDALLLALMALEIGSGHEVITTPFTFVATAGAIARLGARPVFVDIDPVTYNLDPHQLDRVISPRTKAGSAL